MHIIAAKAVALREALGESFKLYQGQLVRNASAMADRLAQHEFRIVSGGTDNHLFLLDVSVSGLTGKQAQVALEAAAITVNKNTIPYDPNPPLVASGIRIGTPAVTSREMQESEMSAIADLIAEVLREPEEESVQRKVRAEVQDLCKRFPLYGPLD